MVCPWPSLLTGRLHRFLTLFSAHPIRTVTSTHFPVSSAKRLKAPPDVAIPPHSHSDLYTLSCKFGKATKGSARRGDSSPFAQ
ncbi:hypothetical protein BaRGS_00036891 [Batillaria attramentaria]|uniref:Secreted protein n=1 Tax=Batillaria attramentaria TaxID=370345 RepID=A0ABD0JAI8_9CAEN